MASRFPDIFTIRWFQSVISKAPPPLNFNDEDARKNYEEAPESDAVIIRTD